MKISANQFFSQNLMSVTTVTQLPLPLGITPPMENYLIKAPSARLQGTNDAHACNYEKYFYHNYCIFIVAPFAS